MAEQPKKSVPPPEKWHVERGDRGGGNFDVVPDSPVQRALGRMEQRTTGNNTPVVRTLRRVHHDK